ncbi:heme-binding protein soul4 [Entelurus aequoreus]|uniref:heme-binding protein soul4 n=1 Tax=Entelurus aequoreus TaxID=161455 RepID=UPI002B1E6B69|nr:heme-binding protein soul4 [Entelurus aequoreus]XP_061889078.1 heme-binding protein soul4 [Entelurus aequoreus]
MALISLEDLEGLDEEQQDDDITDNPEPMGEEDSDRLLSHWRAVASTHQVSVPTEMTGPIQEMTRNSQQREPAPFMAISCQEMGEVMYEERAYPAGKWACVTQGEELYEQSISMSFMKLMRFICKENSAGRHLGMTVPVVSTVHVMDDGKTLDKSVLTGFYLPAAFQNEPPRPSDPDVGVVHREAFRVVSRAFFGTTTEETVMHQIRLLRELLGTSEEQRSDYYMVAVYENPGVTGRRNEIWFIRRNL